MANRAARVSSYSGLSRSAANICANPVVVRFAVSFTRKSPRIPSESSAGLKIYGSLPVDVTTSPDAPVASLTVGPGVQPSAAPESDAKS